MEDKIDCCGTLEPICPYCGTEQQRGCELERSESSTNRTYCDECGVEFDYTQEVIWYTKKKDEDWDDYGRTEL